MRKSKFQEYDQKRGSIDMLYYRKYNNTKKQQVILMYDYEMGHR